MFDEGSEKTSSNFFRCFFLFVCFWFSFFALYTKAIYASIVPGQLVCTLHAFCWCRSHVVLDFLEGVVFLKSVIRSLLLPTGKPSWKNAEPLGPVVQKVDNSIHWLAQLVLLLFIHWIAIYPVDSAIHRLKN